MRTRRQWYQQRQREKAADAFNQQQPEVVAAGVEELEPGLTEVTEEMLVTEGEETALWKCMVLFCGWTGPAFALEQVNGAKACPSCAGTHGLAQVVPEAPKLPSEGYGTTRFFRSGQ